MRYPEKDSERVIDHVSLEFWERSETGELSAWMIIITMRMDKIIQGENNY